MIQISEHLQNQYETDKLGFSIENPQFIPEDYLKDKFFMIFRTCLSFGDWAIISAMPKLIKKKYPDSTVAVPSPELLHQIYPTGLWINKHDDFHANVNQVFANNPYVDGSVDELPSMQGVYHDHFRIYDPNNLNVPLVEQMLLYWRFLPEEIEDSAPDLYWSDEEKEEGDKIIEKHFGSFAFGFLYIDDSFFEVHDPIREPLDYKRQRIQAEIDKHSDLSWLYFAGKDISETVYSTNRSALDVRSLDVSLRVQSYIKSKSNVLIGHQGGYGSDCMSRYTKCYVVPNTANHINEHFIRTTQYLLPE